MAIVYILRGKKMLNSYSETIVTKSKGEMTGTANQGFSTFFFFLTFRDI